MKKKNIPYTVAPDGKIVHSNGEVKPKKDWFDVVNYIFLGIFAFLCLYPFINLLLTSVADGSDLFNNVDTSTGRSSWKLFWDYMKVFLVVPKGFNLKAYVWAFCGGILDSLLNTVVITVIGVVYSVVMMSLGGYALTKKDLPGKNIFFTLILITMFFGGGAVPFYQVCVNIFGGLKSSGRSYMYLILTIPFGINTFNMILLRNFFSSVPEEVLESAKLDGANEMRILFGLVIPLSLAGIATIAMFQFVAFWNEWYWPVLFLAGEGSTLAVDLKKALTGDFSYQTFDTRWWGQIGAQGGEIQQAAFSVIAIVPIVCIYPFIQKYFVKGVMLGAVKS